MTERGCRCGKATTARQGLEGREVRCQNCGGVIGGAEEEETALPPAPGALSERKRRDVLGRGFRGQLAERTERGPRPSVAGRLRVDWGLYVRCHPWRLVSPVVAGLAAGWVWLWMGRVAGLGALAIFEGLVALGLGLWVVGVNRQFRAGAINGGVVAGPNLIAVYTNMRRAGATKSYPFVRIARVPLSRGTGGQPAVGERVAVACLYEMQHTGAVMYETLHVDPVTCATRDPEAIAYLAASVPEWEWSALAAYLGELKERRPGGYPMWEKGKRLDQEPLENPIIWLFLLFVAILVIGVPVGVAMQNAAAMGPGMHVLRH